MSSKHNSIAAGLSGLLLLQPRIAWGLDKQTSAHAGSVEVADSGQSLEGAVILGTSIQNSSYAARPDNTGLALFRYAFHADIDLIGRHLSIPLDVNSFTDGRRKGASKLSPSELDLIGGLATTWRAGPGALEFGLRYEQDRPLDTGSFTQQYADARTRYLYSLATVWPTLGKALDNGDVSGWLTFGYFARNRSYAARPDNTGLALFRYAFHTELSVWHDYISVALDTNWFSDRRAKSIVRPTELDLTPEIILRLSPWELHLAWERDTPVDRSGLSQTFSYAIIVYGFGSSSKAPAPLETRGHVIPK